MQSLRVPSVVFGLGVLVVGSLSCGATAPGTLPDGLKDPDALEAFQQELVDAHNAARAAASPSPSPPLPPMTWSSAAASVAQDWANRCVFEHRQPNDLGENLALFSQSGVAPAEVVQLWAAEAADYDYAGNSCAAGAQCGHYTQVVWRGSTSVGCGVADCADVEGFGRGSLWVCNYDPPGNFIGERPY